MSTNYYVTTKPCECCKRYDEHYHIGKSSMGWAFSFQGYPDEQLNSWKAWKEFLKNEIIMNEYGEQQEYEAFVEMIETYKAPGYMNEDGHVNLQQNTVAKKDKYPWFNPSNDWDDEDGYAFSSGDFS